MRFSIQPAMRINKRTRPDAALATLISKYPELGTLCIFVLCCLRHKGELFIKGSD